MFFEKKKKRNNTPLKFANIPLERNLACFFLTTNIAYKYVLRV